MKTTTTLIDRSSSRGAYDMLCERRLIDHPEHGRLLLIEGFGGGEVEGQCYRWKHGLALAVRDADTLESIKSREDRYMGPVWELYPALNWSGLREQPWQPQPQSPAEAMATTQLITISEHECREWARLAASATFAFQPQIARRFGNAAAHFGAGSQMPIAWYDNLQTVYRAWLVFGWGDAVPMFHRLFPR